MGSKVRSQVNAPKNFPYVKFFSPAVRMRSKVRSQVNAPKNFPYVKFFSPNVT